MRSSNQKSKRNVLLLKSGDVAPPLSLWTGDYDRWFATAFGPDRARLTLVQAHKNQKLPDGRRFDAVVMTGSPLSVTHPQAWMFRAAEVMLNAAEHRVAVLGVCFGHQLLAKALGGRVIKNPRGRETGSVRLQLTAQGRTDPLFAGVPAEFVVQATHEDIVHLPAGATALAGNANTAIQAAAFGPRIRGVQFHPELSAAGVKALIQARAERLDAEGVAVGEPAGSRIRSLMSSLAPSPHSRRILFNFLEHF